MRHKNLYSYNLIIIFCEKYLFHSTYILVGFQSRIVDPKYFTHLFSSNSNIRRIHYYPKSFHLHEKQYLSSRRLDVTFHVIANREQRRSTAQWTLFFSSYPLYLFLRRILSCIKYSHTSERLNLIWRWTRHDEKRNDNIYVDTLCKTANFIK